MPTTIHQGDIYGVHCANPPHLESDTFYENYIDIAIWKTSDSNDATRVKVQNHRLEITHSSGPQYNGLTTRNPSDLTSDSVYARITDAGNQSIFSHEAQIQLYADGSNAIWFTITHNTVSAWKLVAGVQTQIGSDIAYSSTNHAWLRIRESSGTTYFDTAPDSNGAPGTWTNRFSQSNPITMTALYIYLKSGCWQAESSGSYAYYTDATLPDDTQDLDTFIADAGQNPSIFNFFQHWGSTDGFQNFIPGYMNAIASYSMTPMLTWEPWVAASGATQPTYSLANIINGNFDSYIIQFATDAAAWGRPFYLRFMHEANGNWYPWSERVNGNSAGQYVRAWKHVYNLFTQYCTNAIWVWCMNTEFSGTTTLSELYPGDDYIDWVAIDLYNWGTNSGNVWASFSAVMHTTYDNILALTGKPLMLAEVSCAEEGGDKADWIDQMLQREIYNYPAIRTFIWFNNNNTPDWRIESSVSATTAFNRSVLYWLTLKRRKPRTAYTVNPEIAGGIRADSTVVQANSTTVLATGYTSDPPPSSINKPKGTYNDISKPKTQYS